MDGLLARGRLDSGQAMYLDALSDLVASYEDAHHPIEPASDADMLRHLLDAKGVTQAEVCRETGIPKSTISEVLSGQETPEPADDPKTGRLLPGRRRASWPPTSESPRVLCEHRVSWSYRDPCSQGTPCDRQSCPLDPGSQLALAFPGDRGKIPRRGDPRPAGLSFLNRVVAGLSCALGRSTIASDRRAREGSQFRIPQVAGRAADRRTQSDRRRHSAAVGHLHGWRRSNHETTVRRRRDGPGNRRVCPFTLGHSEGTGRHESDRSSGDSTGPLNLRHNQSRYG